MPPDLATGWSWNEDGTELTFPLRQGVRWHDGRPFTAKDVKCTWDLLTGTASEKLFETTLFRRASTSGDAGGVSRRASANFLLFALLGPGGTIVRGTHRQGPPPQPNYVPS